MTSSNGNIFRVTGLLCGEFFDLCLIERLSKQSWGWWFETPSCSLWRHCNGSAQVSVRTNDISHGTTTGIVSPVNDILLMKFYKKHSLEFQDIVNPKCISTCNARSAICMEKLHTATQMQNRLYWIVYTLSKYVLFLIAIFMWPTWDPLGTDGTQMCPLLAPWILLSGFVSCSSSQPFPLTFVMGNDWIIRSFHDK